MPKKFKYRFEPMLKVKEHKEKEKQKLLAQVTQEVVSQEQRLTSIDGKRESTIDYQRKRLAGKISVAETLLASRYMVRLKKERVAGEEFLEGLKRVEDERRQELLEAAKQRKIYEMLKEKQQERHRRKLEKAEQKDIDEIATTNYRRTKNLNASRDKSDD
ncbi:flagellar export protein FliJ [candidate division GN15 bacterium]|nr:flagellar export protein FliJ [candidate division GN15 bacterium]